MRSRSSGDLIAGKYRLEKPLARGGMGEVWTARNLQLDVPVAVKLMSDHALSSADLVARFEREARAAAQLRHANVVTIFEHGVFENVPFMAMELLEGEDLSARIKRRGRLTHGESQVVISAVCKALRRAHEMGVVHRDLKPANVFLARQDEDEIVKVLDFGIAKLLGGDHGAQSTKAGGLLGTPHYMPPEQGHDTGTKPDHRSDLWSLAVIAFRMLTGKLPFSGPDAISVIVRICREAPPAASSLAPDLGPRVDAFFVRALSRNPAERFQSAREFGEAFAALGAAPPTQRLDQSWGSAPGSDRVVTGGSGPGSGAVTPAPAPTLAASALTPTAATLAGPKDRTDTAVTVPLQPKPAAEEWQPSALKLLRRTVPLLQTPVSIVPPGPSAPGLAPVIVAPSAAPARSTEVAANASDDGTITRAASETAPRPSNAGKRNNVIVIAALLAAVLVIAVVGWTVVSVIGSPELGGERLPSASPSAPSGSDAPERTPELVPEPSAPPQSATAAVSATAMPSASATASALASAPAASSAASAAPPIKPPARGTGTMPKSAAPPPADLKKPLF